MPRNFIFWFSVFCCSWSVAASPWVPEELAKLRQQLRSGDSSSIQTALERLHDRGEIPEAILDDLLFVRFHPPQMESVSSSKNGGKQVSPISTHARMEALWSKTNPKLLAQHLRPYLRQSHSREAALEIASRFKKSRHALIPELTEALQDQNENIRYLAAKSLSATGSAAQSARPVLKQALRQDSHVGVREFSAVALAHLGPADPDVIQVLRQASVNHESPAQEKAQKALAKLNLDPKHPPQDSSSPQKSLR
jgi:hypothetical protein